MNTFKFLVTLLGIVEDAILNYMSIKGVTVISPTSKIGKFEWNQPTEAKRNRSNRVKAMYEIGQSCWAVQYVIVTITLKVHPT